MRARSFWSEILTFLFPQVGLAESPPVQGAPSPFVCAFFAVRSVMMGSLTAVTTRSTAVHWSYTLTLEKVYGSEAS